MYLESMKRVIEKENIAKMSKSGSSKKRETKALGRGFLGFKSKAKEEEEKNNLSQVGTRLREHQKRQAKMLSFLKIIENIKPNFSFHEEKFSPKNISNFLWRVFSFQVKITLKLI